MKLNRLLVPAVLFAASSSLFASVYTSNFGTPPTISPGDPLLGVDGFNQSEPNVDGNLAFIATLGGSNAGAVGGFYNAPAGSSFYANRPIGGSFAGSSLNLLFSITDSFTALGFTERNNFSFTIANGLGANLFSVNFTPQGQSADPTADTNAQWDVSTTSIGALPSLAFAAVGEDAPYVLGLMFTQNGLNVDYSLRLTDSQSNSITQNGSLTGLAADTFAELRVGFALGSQSEYGDNFLAFQAIPEPGVTALAGLSVVGLLRRRRR